MKTQNNTCPCQEKEKCKWTYSWLGMVIAIFVGVVAALISQGLYSYFLDAESDFSIAIAKPQETTSTLHPVIREITIENSHRIYTYEFNISLIAIERNRNQLPEGMCARFNPASFNLLNNKSVKSKMTIIMDRDSEPDPGDYLIDIIAIGENGKEKKCSLHFNYLQKICAE